MSKPSGQIVWLALLLAGCGASAPCEPGASPHAVVFAVPTLQDVGNYWGLTDFGCHGDPTTVRISDETPTTLVSRVVAHELLHVAGLVQHEEDAGCYLHETVYPNQSHVPCPDELARLQGVQGTYEVRVLTERLLGATQAAARMWNEYAGRDVFVVVDAAEPSP